MSEELLGEDFHAFPVAGGGVLLIPESQIPTPPQDQKTPDTSSMVTQPLVQQSHSRYALIVPLMILAGNLLLVLAVFFVHIYPLLTATVTITIIPKKEVLTTHLTLSSVQSRIFPRLTMTQTKTVPATGHGHQDATQASGDITFYNAATFPQTIDAGTLLIGSDGEHIVTEQIAFIPGATPPIEGQVTISAHALNAGVEGNIPTGDISGACCKENIFAYNSAFSGGANERNFSIVTKTDIATVSTAVLPAMTQRISQAFERQVRPHETRTAIQCSQQVSTDHQAGDEAAMVTVTVSQVCLAGAYNPHDLQVQVVRALAQQARRTLGKAYLLSSYLHISPIQASIHNKQVLISAMYQATMIYHFSNQELHSISHQIAGKSTSQALQLLSQLPGVATIFLYMPGSQSHLPTDTAFIQVKVLVGNS